MVALLKGDQFGDVGIEKTDEGFIYSSLNLSNLLSFIYWTATQYFAKVSSSCFASSFR